MVKQDQALLQTKHLSIHALYDAYAGMLLGYILEVVKDKKTAEDYLVKTFNAVAAKFNEIQWAENNNWRHLQHFAKNELLSAKVHNTSAKTNITGSLPNKYTGLMTEEQKLVFCSVYHGKKTVAQLAKETNKTEQRIKIILKEAFAMIRRVNGN